MEYFYRIMGCSLWFFTMAEGNPWDFTSAKFDEQKVYGDQVMVYDLWRIYGGFMEDLWGIYGI